MSSCSIGTTIVEQIADRESVDPLDLDQPLYDVVDVDALDELVHSSNGDAQDKDVKVSFNYNGYAVTVESGGDVNISETEPHLDARSPTEAVTD